MSAVVDVLQRYSLPNLASARRAEAGLLSWLNESTFYVSTSTDSIFLRSFDYAGYVKAISFDYQRFLFSSIESYVSKRESTFGERANAWPAIRRYYGAFFAAHSLMRALGVSISYLGAEDSASLRKWLSMFSEDVSVRKGTYCIKYSFDRINRRQLTITSCDSSGGVHEQFWAEFGKWINDLETLVVDDQLIIADQFLSEINDAKNILRGGGGFNFNWLSTIRNDINYKHLFNLWLFDQKKNRNYVFPHLAKIDRKSENIDMRADPRREPLRAFIGACDFLVCLAAELSQVLKRSEASNRSFLAQNWTRIAASKMDYTLS